MDLKQIEYFVRVAELGSFTRASAALNIAQPALSRQVRLLEVELRQNLLIRNGRGATTTDAGKILLAHGRGILHQVERAREELGRVRGALAGRVALGLPPSIAKAITVPLTRAFRLSLPDAALSITEGLSASMQESLITGRLDIALLYNATPTAGLEISPLLEEDLYLVQLKSAARKSGQGKFVPLDRLALVPLVIPTRPNAIRMQVESALAGVGLQPTIALEIDGVAAILDLVADGAGSAVLSMNAVAASGKADIFATLPIHTPRLRSKLLLATSSQRPTTLTQQATITLIQQIAGSLVPLANANRSA